MNAIAITAISIEQGRTDYALCSEVCGQGTEFHAERQAMWSALYDGADLTGAEVFIAGHTYCCEHCVAAMTEYGVSYAGSLDSGLSYTFNQEDDMEELDFDNAVPMMYWKRTTPKLIGAVRNNHTTNYVDIWHDNEFLYRTHSESYTAHNIYNELCVYSRLVDDVIGCVLDYGDYAMVGVLYGSFTAIEWAQFVPQEIPDVDLDFDFDF